ncbi:Acyl-CoA dehydrogenase FadE27 [Mycolicibacterium vanbaalenii]|uniref:Acyl-CoA dehydrogenase FadE27 n=1 Tax=Mycolicibacterium vanbaalenii TaxID=110539 RepID=A0A5S9NHV3_MYCVN|nr:acyl-CoA dehydrogenase family protein [Mycolicibacterium vanbaalenii]CAA0089354.1 Acyl-CoA dehydrogenase FadE27 [Mycolicibacterium vanbaalenii]
MTQQVHSIRPAARVANDAAVPPDACATQTISPGTTGREAPLNTLGREEAADLASATRAVCQRLMPEHRVREVAYGRTGSALQGFDTELWEVLCTQIGVGTIAVPEHLGGAGFGVGALGVVGHELGRTLAPVPFLASVVLATGLVLDCIGSDPPPDAQRLAALATGERTAAAVLSRDGGARRPGENSVSAAPGRRGDYVLSGSARHVLHGTAADDLVVAATEGNNTAVFWLDADSDGLTREAEPVLDATRPMSTIRFDGVRAVPLNTSKPVEQLINNRIRKAMAVLSAEQAGANERVLELAVDYAATRRQFGRHIGSFQAVKHRCADMLVDLEWSRSASQAALQAADDQPTGSVAELGWRSSMAKAVCSESLRAASHANLQIHGGIGFTWEGSAHLYLKRARTDEVIFGSPAVHWDRFAAEAGLS